MAIDTAPESVSLGTAARILGLHIGLVRKWLDEYLDDPDMDDPKLTGFLLPSSNHRRVYADSIDALRKKLHGK